MDYYEIDSEVIRVNDYPATIIVNGCFDILHEGHKHLFWKAKQLGDRVIVAVNSDRSARELKAGKWGKKYPIHNQIERMRALLEYVDELIGFDTEQELHELIEWLAPCVLCKGPDYANKPVTGDDLAPVVILDCPEPESAKLLKIQAYGQKPQTI